MSEHSWHDDKPPEKRRATIFPMFGASAGEEAAPVPDAAALSGAKSVEVHARIMRANGDVVEMGQIAGTYKSPVQRLKWALIGKRAAKRRTLRENAFHNRQVAKES